MHRPNLTLATFVTAAVLHAHLAIKALMAGRVERRISQVGLSELPVEKVIGAEQTCHYAALNGKGQTRLYLSCCYPTTSCVISYCAISCHFLALVLPEEQASRNDFQARASAPSRNGTAAVTATPPPPIGFAISGLLCFLGSLPRALLFVRATVSGIEYSLHEYPKLAR